MLIIINNFYSNLLTFIKITATLSSVSLQSINVHSKPLNGLALTLKKCINLTVTHPNQEMI